MKLSVLAGVLLIGSLPACSERAEGKQSGRVVDSSGGSVALGLDSARTYRAVAVSASGSVGGTVSLQATAVDSTPPVARYAHVCGDTSGAADGGGVSAGGVLVWIEGVGAGKPLSAVRRETVVIEDCRFVPRLLAVNAGTTINFFSRDAVSQSARFYREGSNDPLEEIRTVDAGQVVPSERIARVPGMVEARSAEHVSARGFIAVFDHPYFAITDDNGAFTIDNLPAGTYTVKLWHEGMNEPQEQRVVVAPGGQGRLDVTLTVK
jgi:hypothetical protein